VNEGAAKENGTAKEDLFSSPSLEGETLNVSFSPFAILRSENFWYTGNREKTRFIQKKLAFLRQKLD